MTIDELKSSKIKKNKKKDDSDEEEEKEEKKDKKEKKKTKRNQERYRRYKLDYKFIALTFLASFKFTFLIQSNVANDSSIYQHVILKKKTKQPMA